MEASGSKPEPLLETASRVFKIRNKFENDPRNTYEDLDSVSTPIPNGKRRSKGRSEENLQRLLLLTTN